MSMQTEFHGMEKMMQQQKEYEQKLAENIEARDPWQHRSSEMRCRSCMWFVPKVSTSGLMDERGRLGRCRRRAPTMNGYPAVYQEDWCGDHKIN